MGFPIIDNYKLYLNPNHSWCVLIPIGVLFITWEESQNGGTEVAIYTTVTLLFTLMS